MLIYSQCIHWLKRICLACKMVDFIANKLAYPNDVFFENWPKSFRLTNKKCYKLHARILLFKRYFCEGNEKKNFDRRLLPLKL